MRLTDTSDLWWKTAVYYNLNLETYMDWDDDGIGDLAGLAQRLDYLAELGVTCLWLAPFYPSPRQDNGYDIADYFGVDERYGHLGDLVEVVRTAHDRGMRVIVDLVVNHTSDQHPWFRAARSSPDSPYRDFYVWRDEPPAQQRPSMFPDAEDGVWSFDDAAGQYYEHSFYRHQPDLNTANPAVREEIAKVVGFWLQMGVDGFRVDAVPFLIDGEHGDEHDYLRAIRGYVGRRSGHAMLLGEVNVPYAEQMAFFGGSDGDELTMQFDFVANQQLYLALARQEAGPLVEALRARPAIALTNQWANFVRNHDELTLDQLSVEEREEVFAAFAPSEDQRVHGRGIVRRLPPMLDGDPRRVRMVYSLLFSLPGAPVLYYGEEIGMGEHPGLPRTRDAVRTPMQWSSGDTGGFSNADPDAFTLPVVEGSYGPAHVSVSDQLHVSDSLLSFIRTLVHAYRRSPEIGWGRLELLEQDDPAVLAHAMTGTTGQLVLLHNLSANRRTARVHLRDADTTTRVVDMVGETTNACDEAGCLQVELDGYDHRWLRIVRGQEKRLL
ncbi:alpha-amylase family protein [Actinotalea sp. Marseille-Q4924]|uniref:alpha-amylase family protein n=1 Tax=Actinotalea sp. Marseille-Q4924 TaxID=2866571 RepID=UPI001CE438C1|nr:alpha-amylase family protein [Actinotalea sp. Marseille-Q4924]